MPADFFSHQRDLGCIKRAGVSIRSVAMLCVGGVIFVSSISTALAGCETGLRASLMTDSCRGNAKGDASTAIGRGADSYGVGGLAVGLNPQAGGRRSVALGYGPVVWGIDTIAIGSNAGPGTTLAPLPGEVIDGTITIGALTKYIGLYSTAIGNGIHIEGPFDAAHTTAAQASGMMSVAIGGGNGETFTPSGGSTINLNGARASGFLSTAVGTATRATGGGSSAFGLGSQATADNSTAYGDFSWSRGADSVAVGVFSAASGVSSTALGAHSQASGNTGTAVGSSSSATQSSSSAFGTLSRAWGNGSSAFGYGSKASAASSLALGRQATASQTGSVAIGYGSTTNAADTVSVGSNTVKRRIVNLAPGTQANDAVTLAQLQAVTSSPHSAEAISRREMDSVKSELADLRALVKQQQALIAELSKRMLARAVAE